MPRVLAGIDRYGAVSARVDTPKIYGFTDLDGSRPDCWRFMIEVQEGGKAAGVDDYR